MKKIYQQPNISKLAPKAYLDELSKENSYHLIDVRTAGEYKKSHLEGAVNISFLNFSFSKKIKALDKSKPVYIYCQTAHRSPFAAKKLEKLGFGKIVDMKGGYKVYKKEFANH